MCTCIMIKNINSYFGRNMDLDYSLNEKMIVVPRNFEINFKNKESIKNHYAFFGLGIVSNNYPLLAEGSNEFGLSVATLNFPNNAYYNNLSHRKENIAPYELSLYILATCKTIKDVKKLLKSINITNIPFSKQYPLTPVHFMVSDKNNSLVIEPIKNSLNVFDNPYNVLTNNPPFNYHIENIKNYMNLSIEDPKNKILKKLNIKPYSYGQGLIGLPGDYSSSSRFIKALFVKENIVFENSEINDFFTCLESVKMIKGTVKTHNGLEYTRYSCCIDTTNCIYYYKKYNDNNIYVENLFENTLDKCFLIVK